MIKIRSSRVIEDYTEGLKVVCPRCSNTFGREFMLRGQIAYKLLGGQVFWRK